MTEAAVTQVLTPDIPSEIRAARSHLARRFLKNPVGIAALSVLVLIVLAAIFAPLLTSYDPNAASVLNVLQGPGADHY
jgi:peptide/nickel transport system permease protein